MQRLCFICFSLSLYLGLFSAVSCQNTNTGPIVTEKKGAADTSKKLPQGFIDLLFANHRLDEMVAMHANQPNDPNSVWGKFEMAAKLLKEGKKDDAKKLLKSMAEDKDAESRVVLWAWNGLREMGEPSPIPVVLGLVLEVPQAAGCDYLAVYSDKRARYVNYLSGGAIWEKRQADTDKLIEQIIAACQKHIFNNELPIGRQKSPTQRVRFSFLTTAGIMQTEESFDNLEKGNGALTDIFTLSTQMLAYLTTEANKQ